MQRTPGAGVPGSHQQIKQPLGSDRPRRTPKDEEDPNRPASCPSWLSVETSALVRGRWLTSDSRCASALMLCFSMCVCFVDLPSSWRFHHPQGGVSLSQSAPSPPQDGLKGRVLWELLRRETWAKGSTSISLAIPRPRMGVWKERVPRGHATELPGASPPPPRPPRPFWGRGRAKQPPRAL